MDRDTLISMGFSPDRVDWAMRSTNDGNLQSVVDHIIENERRPVPPPGAPSEIPALPFPAPTIDARASVPTPVTPSFPSHPTPPINQPSPSISSLPFPERVQTIPSITPTIADPELRGIYGASLERYKAFLRHEESLNQRRSSSAAYEALEAFFRDELTRRRVDYGLPPITAPPLAPSTPLPAIESLSLRDPVGTSSTKLPPPGSAGSSNAVVATPAQATPAHGRSSSQQVSDIEALATKTAARQIVPASKALAEAIDLVPNDLSQNTSVDAAVQRVHDLRPTFTDDLWTLRIAFDSNTSLNDTFLAESEKRRNAHTARMTSLYNSERWNDAQAAEKQFETEEQSRQQAQADQENARWQKEYADAAMAKIHSALQSMYKEYGAVQLVLWEAQQRKDQKFHYDHSLRALQQIAQTIEDALSAQATLEDERRQKAHDKLSTAIWSKIDSTTTWEESTKLENTKREADRQMALTRAREKVTRVQPHFDFVSSVLSSTIALYDITEDRIRTELAAVMSTVPNALPINAEEEATEKGDLAPSQMQLPSKELITQLQDTRFSWALLLERRHELMNDVRQAKEELRAAQHAVTVQEITQREAAAGREDLIWSCEDMKKAEKDQEKAMSDGFKEVNDERDRKNERKEVEFRRAQEVLDRHAEREKVILIRQAYGTGGGNGAGAANAAAALLQEQMQTQMASNMLWSAHATRMQVISNIGSSNTQWTVKYY